MRTRTSPVLVAALATLGATAAHHIYGGLIYGTHWRLHGAAVAGVIGLGLLALHAGRASSSNPIVRNALGWTLVALVLFMPVLSVGAFEGAYNHLAKNVLFFAGAPRSLLVRMFPPPTYELPNDALFEISGIAQIIPAVWAAIAVRSFVAELRGRKSPGARLSAGHAVPEQRIFTVRDECVAIPDPNRVVHLQFRRFAGCPVCNLHLRSFVREHARIEAAGVREVVVFHTGVVELRPHTAGLPFAVVADPGKRLYAAFGVEQGRRAMLDPRAWGPIVIAVARSLIAYLRGRERMPELVPHGGRFGLPADFLIGTDGRVLASHYGEHVYDQWSVDDVLALVREPSASVRAIAPATARL